MKIKYKILLPFLFSGACATGQGWTRDDSAMFINAVNNASGQYYQSQREANDQYQERIQRAFQGSTTVCSESFGSIVCRTSGY